MALPAILCAGLLVGCGAEPPAEEHVRVLAQTVKMAEFASATSITGDIQARVQADQSFRVGGKIVERRTRRGRTFYGCENYPNCDYTTWDTPQQQKCEKCGAFLLKHHFKNGRGMLYCSNDACETRINHPINKELEKMRERAEAKRKREAEKMAAEAEKKENP